MDSSRFERRWLLRVPLGLALVGALAHAAFLAAGSPPALDGVINWVYDAAIGLAGLTCLARAYLSPSLRAAWIAFGLGLLSWAAADVYWVMALSDLRKFPYPSWADVGYLAALPCLYVGVGLLIRQRVGHLTSASWLDGAIGALAAAAAGTAILAPALVGLTKGDVAAIVTNMAYPLGDILLIAFIVGALAVSGTREAGSLLLVGGGLTIWGLSDSIYLYQEATSSYAEGWLDQGWLAGSFLIAAAALLSLSRQPRPQRAYRSPLLFPALFASIAIGTMVWDHYERVSSVSVLLAAATLVAVLVRLAVSFHDNTRLMTALHSDASTDALTGLSNRRHLMRDLDRLLAGPGTSPHVFALFDLDGFKTYNDSFGHPAGDTLLRRLGHNLEAAVQAHGRAYRLGGDEFCLLAETNERGPGPIVAAARAALTATGDGFSIGASAGVTLLPQQADSASAALRIADNRMYAEKAERPGRVDRQTHDLLLRTLKDRDPMLREHQNDVARLALRVAHELSLDAEAADVVLRAAEFHDIGKIAIPTEILDKPGKLDEVEWELMRKHTLIGERILGASPAMAPVALAVRGSHERWDGCGYPDGLSGEQTPVAARIIFVCDAFDAMRATRNYSAGMSQEDAIAELRRNAGTQFDPRIVEVFCRVVAERGDGAELAMGPAEATELTPLDSPTQT